MRLNNNIENTTHKHKLRENDYFAATWQKHMDSNTSKHQYGENHIYIATRKK